jgi:thioesterase domain-containing protein
MPDIEAATRYLHEHIPLTQHMQVRVVAADTLWVRLSAPIAPNINHRQTAFGGSAASLATLACWTLVHVHLEALPFASSIVIRRSQMQYDLPTDSDFEAFCPMPTTALWQRYIDALTQRDKGRIELASALYCRGAETAHFSGEFVAIKQID